MMMKCLCRYKGIRGGYRYLYGEEWMVGLSADIG